MQPQLPWRMLLARYMTMGARNDTPETALGNGLLLICHLKELSK
ncbi:hypothetical protein BGS_0305 [Beggiatoa sp. SS]|nr:hypothetical protein BGS_0305 [Beggiatoa sp. SS]